MNLSHLTQPAFSQTLSTVIGGDRQLLAVTEFAGAAGSAGIAADRSEIETVARGIRAHAAQPCRYARPADDRRRDLRRGREAALLQPGLPEALGTGRRFPQQRAGQHALFLDRLAHEGKTCRAARMAPLEGSRARRLPLGGVAASIWWHLPDGRTLRVVANPHPKGGVTWVFENLTEKIDLESRYNTRDPGTGRDARQSGRGRRRVRAGRQGPAVQSGLLALWGLPERASSPRRPTSPQSARHASCLPRLVRGATSSRPSPASTTNGATPKARSNCQRVDSELRGGPPAQRPGHDDLCRRHRQRSNVERALKEKNEALQKADQLKNDFVQHVSYELRSPLTNIIGFTELLALRRRGRCNPRQREYVDHIGTSSSVLLTIVNDILDLATVDAGIMELEIAEVPVRQTIDAAARVDRRTVARAFHRAGYQCRRRAGKLSRRRRPCAPDTVQFACQRGQLRAGRKHDLAFLPDRKAMPYSSLCTMTAPACRRKYSTRSSSDSSREPMAAAGVEPVLACRSSRASSNCITATVEIDTREGKRHDGHLPLSHIA